MPNPLRKLPFQYQSQGKRMGGDEPPEASMRKGKAGRTKPSSRVKKKVKPGNRKFVGPLPLDRNGMVRFRPEPGERDPYRDDRQLRTRDEIEDYEAARGRGTRKRVMRREDDEYSKDSEARQGVLDEQYERDAPQKINANSIYYRLRENLSPANQRLLDILTRQHLNPPF